ncbi:MAG: IS91 family transposase [Motiliproteus sp.]
MELATLIDSYRESFESKYALRLLPGHRRAMDAISRCRTPVSGEVLVHCSDCGRFEKLACSCGHRSCPRCQNHEASTWLERQRQKLLPVEYFLVTFTLPAELRALAWQNQRQVYTALFRATEKTLSAFGQNPKHLGADIGMTAVLHTHSRRLIYHPHLHTVVPGGGVNKELRQWKRTRYQYLFNAFALAKVFRGKLLHELNEVGLKPPDTLPSKWVVDCRHAGHGESALEYLSRYLYRGVISAANIIADRNGLVTFGYTDGQSKQIRTETLPGEDFIWRVIQHVLPRGFQRVRNYGFLHHNARKTLHLVQLLLSVTLKPVMPKQRPLCHCSACGGLMTVIGVIPRNRIRSIRRATRPPRLRPI